MAAPGTLTLDANGRAVAAGDWTLASAPALGKRIDDAKRRGTAAGVDASGVSRLDTAGAELLLDLAGKREGITGLDEGRAALVDAVAKALPEAIAKPPQKDGGFVALLARTGAAVENIWGNAVALVGFIGLILATLARVLPNPRRWRATSVFFHIEQTGLDAVPIVALLSFLVGAVVAFLGATVLRDFGASVFTVELVGYSFLREFGVLLTAILLAGRSGSAFTAQIGSMKSREELDAIQALGLDAIELLVLPRLLALLIMLPALTFIAMIAGIVGGGIVGSMSLDITPGMFIGRLHEMTGMRHFWVGMAKAPVFAFLIAAVGCLEGFKVEGSAESVGRHTTASVVQSIFLVIVFDAMFAMFFMKLHV
jgi:phospholipid/cholesterol/gamma-HCH transport system permease protein